MCEEICANDWKWNISKNEYPTVIAAESEIYGQRFFAKCGDGCLVDSLQGE